jgi:putative SbcD/Mre11-related phosphoesterase
MSGNNIRPLIPFPALLIEEGAEKILVVADLHIGWEINLVEKGIYIPSQMSKIQTKLMQLIDEYKPKQLIFLGDIKQAIPKISFEEWENVPTFLQTIEDVVDDVSIILGNHDGNLEALTPPSVRIFPSSGMVVGKEGRIGLLHGHAWPSPRVLGCEVLVMGHVHPVFFFKNSLGLWIVRQVWIKVKGDSHKLAKGYLKHLNVKTTRKPEKVLKEKYDIELNDPRFIVMPSFNDFVGGVSVNRLDRRLTGPLISSGGITMNKAELYLLDGTFIGTIGQIRAHHSS